jgi:hypothetical protein
VFDFFCRIACFYFLPIVFIHQYSTVAQYTKTSHKSQWKKGVIAYRQEFDGVLACLTELDSQSVVENSSSVTYSDEFFFMMSRSISIMGNVKYKENTDVS